MNLLEIILALHGEKTGERTRLLDEWGVDTALWEHIQNCFTQNGMFTKPGREIYEKFYIELPGNYKM